MPSTTTTVAIMNFRVGDVPDEFDITWPLIVEKKIGQEAWEWITANTLEQWVSWYPHPKDYGFIVIFTAKFYSQEDALIYKLKYPESSYAESY